MKHGGADDISNTLNVFCISMTRVTELVVHTDAIENEANSDRQCMPNTNEE